jgi:hypothetical protein
VPDCRFADEQTVNDEENMQCVFLGPFCGFSALTTDSITKKDAKKCGYSYMNDHGFILGNKYRIMKWFYEETALNDDTKVVDSIEELRVVAQHYINPVDNAVQYDGTNLAYNPAEENVMVVAQCQNKYCNLCEDYNLTRCVTCWGRFDNNG